MENSMTCLAYLKCTLILFFRFITFITCTKLTEIPARENSAINFYLPKFRDCGGYNLTDPNTSSVLTVSNNGEPIVSGIYSYRTTVTTLQNGTILLTMHYVSWQDDGTFAIQTRVPGCQWYYTVTLIKQDNQIAFWEKWNDWSQCDTTCGSGVRQRVRECNIEGRCHGQNTQVQRCSGTIACPSWTNWGSWTSCSVTCGSGEKSRRRLCQSGFRIHDDQACAGEASQISTCTAKSCTYWSNWSDWSACSVTCGAGQNNRRRLCMMDTEKVSDEQCSGRSEDINPCSAVPCRGGSYIWSTWSGWSSCSTSCGIGIRSRIRSCLLLPSQQTIHDNYCFGSARDVEKCQNADCSEPNTSDDNRADSSPDTEAGTDGNSEVGSQPDAKADTQSNSGAVKDKPEFEVPYTVIVGGSVAGCIIILLLVIIVLLVHLKHKKDTSVRRRTVYDPRESKQIDFRASRAKSNTGRSETESRMYAEIDDDFLDSEFDATSCNDYGPLPTSASPHGSARGDKKNSSDQITGGGNFFAFDASAVQIQNRLNVPKSANAIRPRQTDAEGYEKPVSSLERQRKLTYANLMK